MVRYAWQDSPSYWEGQELAEKTAGARPYSFSSKLPEPRPADDVKERTAIATELMAELNPDVPEHVTQWWAQEALNQPKDQPTIEELGEQAEQGYRQATVRRVLNHRDAVQKYGARDYTESNRAWLERKAEQDRQATVKEAQAVRERQAARRAAAQSRRTRQDRRTQLDVEPYRTRGGRYLSPKAQRETAQEGLEL